MVIRIHLISQDNSIYQLEKTLRAANLLLSRLIWRWNLNSLPCLINANYEEEKSIKLNWKEISFTLLRVELIAYFQSRNQTIPYEFLKFPKQVDDHLSSPSTIFGKLEKLKIRSVPTSPAGSPFTPLVHTNNRLFQKFAWPKIILKWRLSQK